MSKPRKDTIVNILKSKILAQDLCGQMVRTSSPINYRNQIIIELSKLEHFSPKCTEELRKISKFIRLQLWHDENESALFLVMHRINQLYDILGNAIGPDIFWTLDTVINYAITLMSHVPGNVSENEIYHLIDEIQIANARKIVPKQWDNILSSGDGSKAFIEIFDDVFTNAISQYPSIVIKHLDTTSVLCRLVKEKECDERRFIPWPESRAENRWNPPGKSFLYMSYGDQVHPFNDELTLEEKVCVLECRVAPNTDCCICRFEPSVPGNIIDLSFNDVSLSDYRNILKTYQRRNTLNIVNELLSNQEVRNRAHDEAYIKDMIKKYVESLDLKPTIIDSLTKQYLTLVCSCIYTKVDGTEEEKAKAYKSFHILAEYLIKKGITGIIYPCTRDPKIKGKNIVLFNPEDAMPITGSIRHYHHSGD